jgi:NADPH:quinone reductase-like Zn-dependent oxidoreductase
VVRLIPSPGVKAVHHDRHGGPDVLALADVPDPQPDRHEVLVAVRATGVNRLDVLQRAGPALIPRFSLPHIAGMDIAGDVVAVGPDVSSVAIGDRVLLKPGIHCGSCAGCRAGDDQRCQNGRLLGGNRPGGYAELCAVPATHVFAIPDGMSYSHAATIATACSTAWRGLVNTGRIRVGETVVIHAAGSGVSVFAVQIAKYAGARVIVTSRDDSKLERARALGADVAINSSSGDFAAAVRAATDGVGADLVFDHVGPALFQESLRCLRAGGRLAFCGVTTGPTASFDLAPAYHAGLTLLGVPNQRHSEFAAMLDVYWRAGFSPVIDTELPLSEAAEAHRRIEANDVFGKIVLVP